MVLAFNILNINVQFTINKGRLFRLGFHDRYEEPGLWITNHNTLFAGHQIGTATLLASCLSNLNCKCKH